VNESPRFPGFEPQHFDMRQVGEKPTQRIVNIGVRAVAVMGRPKLWGVSDGSRRLPSHTARRLKVNTVIAERPATSSIQWIHPFSPWSSHLYSLDDQELLLSVMR
jgi:hypothetical protein